MKTKLVIATRENQENFFKHTAAGKSLASQRQIPDIELILFVNNKEGLPKIYNEVIRESFGEPINLIFAHDDIFFLDFFWHERILEALKSYEIIGIAGNKRRVPKQPSWFSTDINLNPDDLNLSGIVGHGDGFPASNIGYFGPSRQKVKLLDGLLFAVESTTLLNNNIFFDEQFKFHFYDLDLCRQAEEKNVSCGTWDISLIHVSTGNFKSASWFNAYEKYLKKWGD